MISLWTRLNAVFFYAVTVLVCLACGSAITALWLPSTPILRELQVNQIKTLRTQQESLKRPSVDRAIMTFDMDADLTGVFNWNVKQLFVYISATYSTPTNGFNEVVIWDQVITSVEKAKIKLVDELVKYPLVDQQVELRDRPIALGIFWDIMPITGILKRSNKIMAKVRLPKQYCRQTEVERCDFEVLGLEEGSEGGGGEEQDKGKNWAEEL